MPGGLGLTDYLRSNLFKGIQTSPFRAPLRSWALVPVFVLVSVTVGFPAGLYEPQWLDSTLTPFLPFVLMVFPSLLEEAFFRGVLIPRDVLERGRGRAVGAVVFSTLVFVFWHPFNALAFNPTAIPLFLNPWFLLVVGVLGLTCGYAYVVSRSLWVPVMIHWATVTVWVLFLGGRNLVLEM